MSGKIKHIRSTAQKALSEGVMRQRQNIFSVAFLCEKVRSNASYKHENIFLHDHVVHCKKITHMHPLFLKGKALSCIA